MLFLTCEILNFNAQSYTQRISWAFKIFAYPGGVVCWNFFCYNFEMPMHISKHSRNSLSKTQNEQEAGSHFVSLKPLKAPFTTNKTTTAGVAKALIFKCWTASSATWGPAANPAQKIKQISGYNSACVIQGFWPDVQSPGLWDIRTLVMAKDYPNLRNNLKILRN